VESGKGAKAAGSWWLLVGARIHIYKDMISTISITISIFFFNQLAEDPCVATYSFRGKNKNYKFVT
jgi:hypothetical protein